MAAQDRFYCINIDQAIVYYIYMTNIWALKRCATEIESTCTTTNTRYADLMSIICYRKFSFRIESVLFEKNTFFNFSLYVEDKTY